MRDFSCMNNSLDENRIKEGVGGQAVMKELCLEIKHIMLLLLESKIRK